MQRTQEPQSGYQMEHLTTDERSLLIAQRRYDLGMVDLAHAALMLGDNETASHCGARSSMGEMVNNVQAAIALDDDERCACPMPEKLPDKSQPPKYLDFAGVPFFSAKHDNYVRLYRCFQCGHLQALPYHPDTPDFNASTPINTV